MAPKVERVSQVRDIREKFAADLDQALDVAGIGWYNLKYSLVLSLLLVAAVVEFLSYSVVLPAAVCDLDLSNSQRGFIASIPYIGILLTSYPWGYLIDTRGRKKTVIYSSLAGGLFSLLSAIMPNMYSFVVFKLLASFCVACPSAVPFTFIGEIIPAKYKDFILSVVNSLQIIGSALVPLLGWAVIPLDFRIEFGAYTLRSWRLLVVIYSLLPIIAACVMLYGPESPKYLVSQRKYNEALEVLQKMYASNKGKSPEDYPITKIIITPNAREEGNFLTSIKVQTFPLLKWNYLKWLLLNGFLFFGMFSILNGLYIWVPDVLNRVLTSSESGRTACEVIFDRFNQMPSSDLDQIEMGAHEKHQLSNKKESSKSVYPVESYEVTNIKTKHKNAVELRTSSFFETTISNKTCDDSIDDIALIINLIAQLTCAAIATIVSTSVKIIGKKNLLIAVFFVIGIFCILINFTTNEKLFAVLMSSFPILVLAMGPVNAYGIEIFPTHLRGMAMSLALMLGRMGSITGTNVAGLLINTSCESMFYFFGILLLVCGALSFLLPNSRSLSKKKEKTITRL